MPPAAATGPGLPREPVAFGGQLSGTLELAGRRVGFVGVAVTAVARRGHALPLAAVHRCERHGRDRKRGRHQGEK
ncbi:hypothetical protein [Streptomyces badius]